MESTTICRMIILLSGGISVWAAGGPQATPTVRATSADVNQLQQQHWGYRHMTDEIEPALWSGLYPQCNGTRQSPIALDTPDTIANVSLGPLTITDYDQHPAYWTVINNGHVVQYSGGFARQPTVSGGGLGDEYAFMQLHFHWGATDAGGSEHVVDGRRFPLELHIVHRRVEDSESAMGGDPLGIAVVAVFFQVSPNNATPNPHIEALTRAVETVLYQGETRNITLPEVELSDLLPASSSPYYRYLGSLTTPPCSEAVIWTVLATPLSITEDQLKRFRELHERPRHTHPNSVGPTTLTLTTTTEEDDLLGNNYRQVQPLDGRQVYFYPGTPPTTTPQSTQPASPTTTTTKRSPNGAPLSLTPAGIVTVIIGMFVTFLNNG